jgi:hypothetical protein
MWSRLPRSAQLCPGVFTARHRALRLVLAAQTMILLAIIMGQRWFSAGGHDHPEGLMWTSSTLSGLCLLADGIVRAPKVRALLVSLGLLLGCAVITAGPTCICSSWWWWS